MPIIKVSEAAVQDGINALKKQVEIASTHFPNFAGIPEFIKAAKESITILENGLKRGSPIVENFACEKCGGDLNESIDSYDYINEKFESHYCSKCKLNMDLK